MRCHAEAGTCGSAGACGTQEFVSWVPHSSVYLSESPASAGPEVTLRGWVGDASAGLCEQPRLPSHLQLHGPSEIASLCPWACLCCAREQVEGERMGKRTKLPACDHGICILWMSPRWYATGKEQIVISPPSALPEETHLCVVWLRMFL